MSLQAIPAPLLGWYDKNRRSLPWREEVSAYRTWVSEIMLQQTRVAAALPYFQRFMAAFPTVEALAQADTEQVLKLWEGLGYYSRVRNLQKAAQVIVTEHDGVFPREYDKIRALPGVGDYTAGAVASICFDLPCPAVDGNVLRVLSRLLADHTPVTRPQTKKDYTQLLAAVYPLDRPGDFTQSLMELGATVCVPNGAPKCDLCPLSALCQARAAGIQLTLPVKEAKREKRVEEKTVFLLRCGDEYAFSQRPNKGLLAGLWEFPNMPGKLTAQEAISQAEDWGLHPRELVKYAEKEHIFTHIRWQMRGYYLECRRKDPRFTWADGETVENSLALPTAFRIFWESPIDKAELFE